MNEAPTHAPSGATAPVEAPVAAAPGRPWTGSRRGRNVLSIRWIVTAAAVALTTGAVLSVGVVAERNTRRALAREAEARLLLEARNLALTSSEALLNDFPELTLHPFLKEMKAREPELAFALVVDKNGVIQGDPDARELGGRYRPSSTLAPVQPTQPLGAEESIMGNHQVLVVTSPVLHRNGRTIGTAIVALRRGHLERMIQSARRQQTLVLGVFLVLGIASAYVLMSFLLRPIETLRAGIERIGRGDLDTPVRLRDHTELGLLAVAVNDMAAELKRAQSEMVERESLAHEVELARQIQSSLLPSQKRVAGDFVIEGSQHAAAEVGGDFYDYFPLADGRIGIAVADVAGKGLAGCMVMSMLSALLRAMRTSFTSPAGLLAALDDRLGETLQPGSFVTMFYGALDSETGTLVYASAGHSPVLIYRGSNQGVEWLKSKGIPLGAVRGGAIRATLADSTITLGPGDALVQFTDGINEAFDPTWKEQFGFKRMEEVVRETAPRGAAAIIDALHSSVRDWTGEGPPHDDETVLVVSYEGVKAEQEPGPKATAGSDPLARLAEAQLIGTCMQLRANLEGLTGIRGWVEACFKGRTLGETDFELLSTALYEACANVVEHGYDKDSTSGFELWWVPDVDLTRRGPGRPPREPSSARGGGYFLIRDHGRAFSADNWTKTDFSDPVVWKRGRGFGLDIIHRAMSQVAYHPGTALGNITLMTFDPTFAAEEGKLRHA